ncbi:DUF3995 domain-containing protein [Kitasatospora sp. NPDC085879]|uniref:DUF3995 domain-containing protein n=1 Tax=Kitasatospora sp. NPDC085879 TaxID=3154769 RepID=UPI00343AD1C3
MDTDARHAADGTPPTVSLPAIRRAAAWAACAWATAFSLIHLYWLLGGRAGLPAGHSLYANTPLLVIDIVAIPLCAAAAAFALALVRPWGTRLPRRLHTTALWATTALLILHAAPSVPDWVALAAGTRTTADLDAMVRFAALFYEPFFMTGGLLFALASLRTPGRRRPRR